jgi:hypothetical protein
LPTRPGYCERPDPVGVLSSCPIIQTRIFGTLKTHPGSNADIRYWHLAEVAGDASHFRFRAHFGLCSHIAPRSANDPKRTSLHLGEGTFAPTLRQKKRSLADGRTPE